MNKKDLGFKIGIQLKMLLYIIIPAVLIYSVATLYIIYKTRKDSIIESKSLADAYAKEYANYVKAGLSDNFGLARSMAHGFLGYDKLDESTRHNVYSDILKNVLLNNKDCISSWLSWELSTIDKNWKKNHGRLRYVYYWENNEIKFSQDTLDTDGDKVDQLYYQIKTSKKEVLTEPYYYSYNKNSNVQILESSIAIPIISNDKFLGLVGFDVTLDWFQEKIKNFKPFNSGQGFIVSNKGVIISHPDERNIGKNISVIHNNFTKYNTIDSIVDHGYSYSFVDKSDNGNSSYITFAPIKVGECVLPWSFGLIIPMDAITAKSAKSSRTFLFFGAFGLIVMTLLSVFFSRNVVKRIIKTTVYLDELSLGKIGEPEKMIIQSKDEIGMMMESLRSLAGNMKKNTDFAEHIGKNNLTSFYWAVSKHDILGQALMKMRDNLLELSHKNQQNEWMQKSLLSISGVNHLDKSINELANELLCELSKTVNLSLGTIYSYSDQKKKLQISGTFGISFEEVSSHTIKKGEGILGQVVVGRKMISMDKIPDHYYSVKSSLGMVFPEFISVFPLLYQEKIVGVLEIAFRNKPTEIEFEFLAKAMEIISISIHSKITQSEMEYLLDKTQEQSMILQNQQEELKVSNEELETQTKVLINRERELQNQQEELRVTNEELHIKTESLYKQKQEIVNTNEELITARNELVEKAKLLELTSKYKSEFLANMSHELRTPLNSLLLLAHNLCENHDQNLTPTQIEFAQIIYKSGNDLLNLINDILDISKIESGKLQINYQDVQISDIVDNINRNFRYMIDSKDLFMEINIDENLPNVIYTDQIRIEQIIKNLISNAIKFTQDGGITININLPTSLKTKISRKELKKESICFQIRDTGIGISNDKLEYIFEAFNQEDGSISRKYGGTGLGLSITRELTRLLDGEILIESEVGVGSVFTIVLPLTKSNEPDSIQKLNLDNIDTGSLTKIPKINGKFYRIEVEDDRENINPEDQKILIIEDDVNFLSTLVKQSREKGFKCLATTLGEEGLVLASQYLPEAIILDVKLPGMDGFAVLNQLKAQIETRHIPVHMMSAAEQELSPMNLGAIGFTKKPFNINQIESAFKNISGHIEKNISKLLIVLSDLDSLKKVNEIVAGDDVAVYKSTSGEEALNLIAKETFDCIIMDLQLIDMTGFEFLENLTQKYINLPPIIVYTSNDISVNENLELQKYTHSIIINGEKSQDRLLDETALFLHSVVSELPLNKQKIISDLHNNNQIFRGKKILLVDDDMRNIFALSKLLEDMEISVFKAENGQKAIEILNSNEGIDLVLMDIMMPVMDGYEAMQHIRKRWSNKELPVIALTAKAMKEDKEKCIAAGATDYMTKPIDINKLFSLLRVWLYR